MKRLTCAIACIALVFGMMFSSFPAIADENQFEKSTFSSWTDYNIYAGKNELTNISTKLDRANLAYMITEAFNLQMLGEPVRIVDVNETDWYYNYVQTVVSHGIMELDNDSFKPSQYVTREQIPTYLSFLPITIPEVEDITTYVDIDDASEAYAENFKKFVAAGYMSNLSTNYVFPNRIATISDMIVILDKIFPNVSGTVSKGSVYNGNFIIKEKMTYLENLTINGDLIITQGAMESNFVKGNYKISLVNVKVNGNIYIFGGSLYGGFFFTNIMTNSVNIMTESPTIFKVVDCDLGEIHNRSSIANFYTNSRLNISEDSINVIIEH